MRRPGLLVLLAFALALAACGGDGDAEGSSTAPTGVTATGPTAATGGTGPSGTTSPPSEAPRPIPPAWASPVEEDLDPTALPDDVLIPPNATLTARVELPAAGGVPDQVAIAYTIGDDPLAAEHGFAVWQRFATPPAWSVVSAFVDAPQDGILGITLEQGDLTGDGHDEVLVFEDRGGSGACGTWTVVSGGTQDTTAIFHRETCDAELQIVDETLQLREAVFEADDPHCCPSAFRTRTLEWNGDAFDVTASEVEPTQG